MNPLAQQLLNILTIAAGALEKSATGEVAEYSEIAGEVLQIAQLATQVHSQNAGVPLDQVIAQLHDIPGPVITATPRAGT